MAEPAQRMSPRGDGREAEWESRQSARAIVADDEPHLRRALEQRLRRCWPGLAIVGRAENGLQAADLIDALRPDVAFLDIQMPGLTGLEVVQQVQHPCQVVFVTAFDQFAVQAFEHSAVDYVLKPVQEARLKLTVARLQSRLAEARPPDASEGAALVERGHDVDGGDVLPAAHALHSQALLSLMQQWSGAAEGLPTVPRLRIIRAGLGAQTHHIPIEEVLYFHADEKYTVVRTATQEHLIRTSLTDLLPQLDPEAFAQIHRATIVRLAAVAGTRRDANSRLFVTLRGLPQELPVSRAYVALFKPM